MTVQPGTTQPDGPDMDLAGPPARPAREWVRRNIPAADVSGSWRPEVIAGGLSNITYRLPLPANSLLPETSGDPAATTIFASNEGTRVDRDKRGQCPCGGVAAGRRRGTDADPVRRP